MAGQPQAGAQALALGQQAPQPAVGADGAGAAVAQLQAQINSLQVQIFRLAVSREMAVINVFLGEYPTSPQDIIEQKYQQVIKFNQVYSELPNHIADSILNDKQQYISRYTLSQLWEDDNQEALKWMIAVEYVAITMFASEPVAVTVSTELTTAIAASDGQALVSSASAPPVLTTLSVAVAGPQSCVASGCSLDGGSLLPAKAGSDPSKSVGGLGLVGCPSEACESIGPTVPLPGLRSVEAPRRVRRRRRAARSSSLPRRRRFPRVRLWPRICPKIRRSWTSVRSALGACCVFFKRSIPPRSLRPSRDFRSRPRCKMRTRPGRCPTTIASIRV